MSVLDSIEEGLYKNQLSYTFIKKQVHDDMTIREARELTEFNKKANSEHLRQYGEETARLERLFHFDLAVEHKLLGHPKENLLFSMAWERGHSEGLRSVAICYEELAELLS